MISYGWIPASPTGCEHARAEATAPRQAGQYINAPL